MNARKSSKCTQAKPMAAHKSSTPFDTDDLTMKITNCYLNASVLQAQYSVNTSEINHYNRIHSSTIAQVHSVFNIPLFA